MRFLAPLTPTDTLLERVYLIPDELIERPQFVVWRNEDTKVPYQAAAPRRRAKVNDPTTWATFSQALDTFANWFERADRFDGIGYVFSADDPYVGVDLDDCLSGDTIHPEALKIIRALNGYAEVSPSGTGVKVWTRGKLAIDNTGKQADAPWGGQIEIYRSGRWFAMTGWRVEL